MLVIDVLGRALLRAHGQPGMDWVLNPKPIFAIKLGGKMSGVIATFSKEAESASFVVGYISKKFFSR